jgi:predicted signal transduction protein with EAL and GGDEF domain
MQSPRRAELAALAAGVTEQIVSALAEPFSINTNRIHSGGTVGIAVYGPESPDAETMLAHADVALYRAKAEQRGTYRFFSDGMDTEVRARVSMGADLREALALDQFFLMYQPQVDIVSGRIAGLERLWCVGIIQRWAPWVRGDSFRRWRETA